MKKENCSTRTLVVSFHVSEEMVYGVIKHGFLVVLIYVSIVFVFKLTRMYKRAKVEVNI